MTMTAMYEVKRRPPKVVMEWHEDVYRVSQQTESIDRVTRLRVLRRDHYTCQVKDCTVKRGLEAHHIMPREQGGATTEENLITLCRKHHDMIELAGLRTAEQIRNFSEVDDVQSTIEPDEPPVKDWREWVYGGARNPLKGRQY